MRRQARALLDAAQRPLVRQLDQIKAAIGRQESRLVAAQTLTRLRDAEFKVYSQWGEDGIIQYLIHKVPIADPSFIEFGVEDYSEANTRFLLVNDNWRGVIFDSGTAHVDFVRYHGLGWRYELDARTAFITPENVNDEFRKAGMTGDIGLLSIDIDGNDYWVFEAVDVVSPRIVIVEYNSVFGPDHAVTVLPDAKFDRTRAHHSTLYFGASVAAFTRLAAKKGYSLVGSNTAGNNLFYVRDDVVGSLPVVSPRDGWVASRFRESRDPEGNLTFVGPHRARLELIRDMTVLDLTTERRVTIGELYGLGAR
jgi:hypothetical protein